LNGYRKPSPCLTQCLEHSHQRRFTLQYVLAGFDQQDVNTTRNQGCRLFVISRSHVIKTNVT